MLENKNIHGNKPFLRWAGSKRQLLPLISRYWRNDYTRYIEPFAGSAALFFYLTPKSAILGDINKELIFTYIQVKNNLRAVLHQLQKMAKSKEYYYKIREIDPSTLNPSFRAARFIYLNRFCFNGLYRTNLAGKFNVPYGGDKAGDLPTETTLKTCSALLQNASLIDSSFEQTLEQAKSGDFVYLDPPFSVKAKRIFNEYDASIFNVKQLSRLHYWMTRLSKKNIPFLVSYAESDEGYFLGKGFYIDTVRVRRNIAGFAANRHPTNELLISNTGIVN